MVHYTRDALASKTDTFVHDIGAFTYGVPHVHWWRPDCRLVIGRYCAISGGVNIFLGGNHRTEWATTYPFSDLAGEWPTAAGIGGTPTTKGDVRIGHDVWIGAFATILSGTTIGDGAVIGAHAVVSKDVPPYGIAVGNPARTVRSRFAPEIVARMRRVRWWDWPVAKVAEALPLMLTADLSAFLARYDDPAGAAASDAADALAAPVTVGLIASLDFGRADTIVGGWGDIAACTGADGTVVQAEQTDPVRQPARIWKHGRYAARFVAANRQSLDMSGLLAQHAAVFAGPHSIVALAQAIGAAHGCVVDICRAGGTVAGEGANRSALLANGNTRRWCFRQGGTALDAPSAEPIAPDRPEVLVGCRDPSGAIALTCGGVTRPAAGVPTASDLPDTATLGVRTADGQPSMFFDGYVWRLLIYDRALTQAEIATLTEWGEAAVLRTYSAS